MTDTTEQIHVILDMITLTEIRIPDINLEHLPSAHTDERPGLTLGIFCQTGQGLLYTPSRDLTLNEYSSMLSMENMLQQRLNLKLKKKGEKYFQNSWTMTQVFP